ncbi:hypothetical protein SAMN05444342_3580 [Haladaptatus paucihalophilus DX253]|uniref:Uncharacterized protein n=1 Tax=Haladaptatus paucihalophilus DX253 TaxID=797209 RepID=A0A1M6ZUG1_HALPU|nr:hypothetical protein SAMN05444342_3580 [Haladaptatus paucihalophilus DX253]
MRSDAPVKNKTATLAAGVNWVAGTILLLIVAMTFRPTVHAPRKPKPTNKAAAVAFRRRREPTAGPNATPVDEPPILNPTKTATTTPATVSTDTIGFSLNQRCWNLYKIHEARSEVTLTNLQLFASLCITSSSLFRSLHVLSKRVRTDSVVAFHLFTGVCAISRTCDSEATLPFTAFRRRFASCSHTRTFRILGRARTCVRLTTNLNVFRPDICSTGGAGRVPRGLTLRRFTPLDPCISSVCSDRQQ